MKRKLAIFGAILSALYLLTAGPVPDPIPFLDEGVALAFFIKCMRVIGYDLTQFLPFLRAFGAKKNSHKKKHQPKDVVIDV